MAERRSTGPDLGKLWSKLWFLDNMYNLTGLPVLLAVVTRILREETGDELVNGCLYPTYSSVCSSFVCIVAFTCRDTGKTDSPMLRKWADRYSLTDLLMI